MQDQIDWVQSTSFPGIRQYSYADSIIFRKSFVNFYKYKHFPPHFNSATISSRFSVVTAWWATHTYRFSRVSKFSTGSFPCAKG